MRAAKRRAIVAALAGALAVACGGAEPPPKAPPPPPPPADPPALAQMAEACARLSGCTHAHDRSRFRDPGACVDWWLSDSDPKEPLRRCLTEARRCDQVLACMQGGGDARAAAFCGQRPGVVSGCDGDRLVSCGEDDSHESSVLDCAAMGATCRDVKSAGGLVLRGCYAPQKCPAGGPEARCDGPSAVVSCRDGAYERVACRPGTVCEERQDEGGETAASCELPGRRRCDVGGPRHCDADRLVECDRAGRATKARVTDCVGFGLKCTGIGPRAGCHVPSDVECDKELLPRCEGTSLVFCAAGRKTRVACSALGFSACDPTGKGSMAACAGGAGLVSPPANPAK
jgi:hypothetical protein